MKKKTNKPKQQQKPVEEISEMSVADIIKQISDNRKRKYNKRRK